LEVLAFVLDKRFFIVCFCNSLFTRIIEL